MRGITKNHGGEAGVTAVEYALVIGLISLLMAAAAVILGESLMAWTSRLVDTIDALLS